MKKNPVLSERGRQRKRKIVRFKKVSHRSKLPWPENTFFSPFSSLVPSCFTCPVLSDAARRPRHTIPYSTRYERLPFSFPSSYLTVSSLLILAHEPPLKVRPRTGTSMTQESFNRTEKTIQRVHHRREKVSPESSAKWITIFDRTH